MAKPKLDPKLKAGKYYLKLRGDHPTGKYKVLSHVVETQCKEFNLDEAAVAELQSPAAKIWVNICDKKQMDADAKLFSKAKKGGYSDHVEIHAAPGTPIDEDEDDAE